MKRQKISGIYADAKAFENQSMTVCGWVRTLRDMKNFGFIELNDGSCFKSLQVVLERGALENYDEIAKQNVGAALIVHGTLVLTPDAPQPFELKADSVAVEGASTPDYPCRRSATAWSSCARSSTSDRAPTSSPPPSACAPSRPRPCTSSSSSAASSTSTPR